MEKLELVPASAERWLVDTRPTARSYEEPPLPAFSQTGARNGSHCACARPAGGAVPARGGGAARPSLSPRPHHTAPPEARCSQPSRSAAVPVRPQQPLPREPHRLSSGPMEDYHKPDQQTLQALKDAANRLRIGSIKATTAAGSG